MSLFAKLYSNITKKLTERNHNKNYTTAAIILAGGSSSRFDEKQAKQFYNLLDMPIILRSILPFQNCSLIDEIIIVSREGEQNYYNSLKEEHGLTKISQIVSGGNSRQESVLNGLESVSPYIKYIAIHDGARCLITENQIETILKETYKNGAAIAGCKTVDTIKKVNDNCIITESPDRNYLWCAQTPQSFKKDMYTVAAYKAKKEGYLGTDDSSLVERAGFKVKIVDCTEENIKITYKKDILIAENIIKNRQK